MPINYVDRINALNVKMGFPPYRWSQNEDVPWTPFAKPLESSTVALISTGGIYHKDQTPFNPQRDDFTFREISRDVDAADLRISDDNYNHSDAEKDYNCVFPLERLKELEKERYIGRVAPHALTMMGRIFRRSVLQTDMAPGIIGKLKEMGTDVVLLVPA